MSTGVGTVERQAARLVNSLLADEPVVLLTGPRTSGKSTVARAVAQRRDARIVDLDDPVERQAAAGNPGLFVDEPGLLVIDEFQYVPELLGAIKAILNKDLRPGRFLLTGSARWQSVPEVARHLTGRAHPVTMWPFSQGEKDGRVETFLDRLAAGDDVVGGPRATLTRVELIHRATIGGYPLAVARAQAPARSRWFTGLVELVLARDATEIRALREPELLERVLRLAAARTASVLNVADLAKDAKLHPDTTGDLLRLLETTYLVLRLPAWSENLNARVAHRPKLHLADPGLAAHLMRLTPASLSRPSGAALTRLGQLLETFAVTEMLRQASWHDPAPSLYHFRTKDGIEVDLIVEFDDGSVAAIEVKAASRIHSADLRGLRFVRDRLGDRFRAGIVLCTADHPVALEDRIAALPFETIWTA